MYKWIVIPVCVCVCLPAHLTPWAMSPHIKLAQYSHQCGPLNVCTCSAEGEGRGNRTVKTTHTQLRHSIEWHTGLQQQNWRIISDLGTRAVTALSNPMAFFNPLRQLISRSVHRGTEDVYTGKRKEQREAKRITERGACGCVCVCVCVARPWRTSSLRQKAEPAQLSLLSAPGNSSSNHQASCWLSGDRPLETKPGRDEHWAAPYDQIASFTYTHTHTSGVWKHQAIVLM